MNITINGNDHTIDQIETIEDMLTQLGLGEKLVIVEQNRQIIDRAAYGQTVVRVLKTDEIAKNGIHLGDYVQADGEKIHEQLFEATMLSVSSRYTADISENDNKED